MKPSRNRKLKAFYFVATLLTLGFIVPATIPSTLSAYIGYASALGSLTALFFGANIGQKKWTQESYIKELELEQQQGGENLGA